VCEPPAPPGFVADLERIVATARAHLDYLHNHPGVLPPR
jgi:hypothetical protein